MNENSENPWIDERQIETSEYVRLNASKMHPDIYYVQLHYKISDLRDFKSFNITAIPIFQVRDGRVSLHQTGQARTWTAEINLLLQQVDFNAAGRIEVISELRNRGLGSEIFSRLIEWVQSYNLPLSVKPFYLAENDAIDRSIRDLRNNFYQNFNFQIEFHDPEQRSGSVTAINVLELRPYRNRRKVEEVTEQQLWQATIEGHKALSDENYQINQYNDQLIWAHHSQRRQLILSWIVTALCLMIAVWAMNQC